MSQRGMTLVELLVVMSVGALVLMATAAYSLPMIAREGARSGAFEMQSLIQLTRAEAVKRNRDCRLIVNTRTRRMVIRDSMGTATRFDDQILHNRTLPSNVHFAAPNGEVPVTLFRVGGPASKRYEAAFSPDGLVSQGPGWLTLLGGNLFTRISLYKAGGTTVSHWNGSAWLSGS